MSLQFVLRGRAVGVLDELLRVRHTTRAVRRRDAIIYMGPARQKREAIERAFPRIARIGEDWFRGHAPGIFASDREAGEFPSILMLLFREAHPFTGSGSSLDHFDDYQDLLGTVGEADVWRFDIHSWGVSDVPIKIPPRTPRRSGLPWIVALALPKGDSNVHNEIRHNLIWALYRDVASTAAFMALDVLLAAYQRQLARLRDQLYGATSGTRRTLRLLSTVQRQVLDLSADVQPIARELASSLSTSKVPFARMRPAKGNESAGHTELLSAWREAFVERARFLQTAEIATRELFVAVSQISAATQTLRATAVLTWLTVLLALIGAVTTWSAIERLLVGFGRGAN